MRHLFDKPNIQGPSTEDVQDLSWRTEFEQELINSATTDYPPFELASKAIEGIAHRRKVQALAARPHKLSVNITTTLAAVAAAALCFVVPSHYQTQDSKLEPEPSSVPLGVAPTNGVPKAPVVDPCANRGTAQGKDALIDDFEDGDDSIVSRDGRGGYWRWARDTDEPGTAPALLPNPRPDAKPGNRQALHVKGEQLRDWGASVELTLQPSCYDVAAYKGITFSARGPGRIYVALRQVDVIPPEFHGTCEHDCYNAHVRKIELDDRFRDYEVRWTEVEQRGYGKPAFDATRLHDIAFQVHPEDTPYDVWIDNLRFIKRD